VPIGDDEHGTWLATVDPGCCLPVIGSGADAMVSTMRLAASSWPWSDRLTVSVDPDLVAHETQLVGSADDEASCDHGGVLFVGDPSMVPLRAKKRCGILTTLPVPATGLTVAVDGRAATIHPLGLTVRPHVLGPRHRTATLELVLPSITTRRPDPTAQPEPGHLEESDVETSPLPDMSAVPPMTGGVADPDPSAPGEPPCSAGRSASMATRSRWPVAAGPDPTRITSAALRPPDGRTAPADPLSPGVVEVRLLVATPRLEGTAAELPPKRVRRATELVAYLALHRPSPVTSDRLRTRVLGSPDADAAAKTLFNVATAARSAMGSGPAGEPLLPPALKTGHYRISELVTVDTDRAARLIAAARSADDPDESLAMYRAALGLVEDEPLSGVLSGYGWWEAEGHAGRIRALVVDAACEVARLASEAGFDDLAGWAIDRARLLDPYSEALSRAAMRWAASSGDTDRLRREWVECQRRVDELDPGSLPSERTERLYAELTRRPN
jgi:hypothetical protein